MSSEFNKSITRRDFLKMCGVGLAGMIMSPVERLEKQFGLEEVETLRREDLETKIPAYKVPLIEYSGVGVLGPGVALTPEMFMSQIDFLKEAGFATLGESEISLLVESRENIPLKSVILRLGSPGVGAGEYSFLVSETKKRGLSFIDGRDTGLKIDSVGEEYLPRVYPYALVQTIEEITANDQNNMRSVYLANGETFDRLIYSQLSFLSVETVESFLAKKYPECFFGEERYLQVSGEQVCHLTRPAGIVIHTDGQSGTSWRNWDRERTYETLAERGIDVHFGVDTRGVSQYLRMYRELVTPTRGASGFGNYISIEMSGRNYDEIFDTTVDPQKREMIRRITDKTVGLAVRLMDQYEIGWETVLGHYAASASGKTDPGRRYMEDYFLPRLISEYYVRRILKGIIRLTE